MIDNEVEKIKFSSIITEARKLTDHGFPIIPLKDKHPIITYGHRRKKLATAKEIDKWFSNGDGKTPTANGIAIAINDTEFGIDTDGGKCESIFLDIISNLSAELQNKIRATMYTKTPRGFHRTFRYLSEDFPKGIKDKIYFKQNGEHGEIALKGRDHYLVERGPGYEIINGVESVITLTKTEVNELLGVLTSFSTEHESLTKVVRKLQPYYIKPNRDSIIFALSGYLHKGRTPEQKIIEIAQRLIDLTGYNDEDPDKVFRTIRDTCAKDRDSDQVSGYKLLHEALTSASPPNSKTDDVSNTIVEIEYTLKGVGLFTIPRREHQQAQQESIGDDVDTSDYDEDTELKGINDNILIKLASHVYAVVSSSPPVLYVAHRGLKCIMKFIIKFDSGEITDPISGQNMKAQRQILLPKHKLIYALPTKVTINDNPLTGNTTYTITFVSKRNKKPFTLTGTISEIINALDKKSKVMRPPEAKDALIAIVERYEQLELAEIGDGITQPGFYKVDGKIRGYGINQRLDLDLRNNEQDRKAVLECIDVLEGLQIRSKKKVALPAVLKWTILSPFSFITKTQSKDVDKWLPWLYLYDTTDTGKTTLITNVVLGLWDKHDKDRDEIHFRGPGHLDSPSKFGNTVSQTTYPVLADEVGALLSDDSKQYHNGNFILDLIKYAVQGKRARSRFDENILALSPLAFTSNSPPPQDEAYRRRLVAMQYVEKEKWTEKEKEDFKRWLVEDDKISKLKVLGDFVAMYVIEHPDILKYSSYLWYEPAATILKEFYKSVDEEPPEWIDLIAEQTVVKEVREEKQLELRGFLQQAISDAYRKDVYTNPDPATTDNDGNRMKEMRVSFEQKINYCLDNKSIPYLHLCKRNLGQDLEVAMTSNIRLDLKKYDRSSGATTMDALASKIPGFRYDFRKVAGQSTRVICGPKSMFLAFVNYEIEDDNIS